MSGGDRPDITVIDEPSDRTSTLETFFIMKLTWLSHASWLIEFGSLRVLLDPFFTDNPAAQVQADDLEDVTHVLVSHGHFDHVADVGSIAKRCGASVIANFETALWVGKQGVDDTVGMNIGGTTTLTAGDDSLAAKMVPAIHSSGLPDGSYGGTAAGFVLTADQRRIYFACDTAFFGDMTFYAEGVDVAVLPIGDLFTMGVDDCVAAIKLIQPKIVLPTHYNTWPPIAQDADAWAKRVIAETGSEARVLKVGEAFEV